MQTRQNLVVLKKSPLALTVRAHIPVLNLKVEFIEYKEFRKLNPSIHIAFATITPGAFNQDAFGTNYQCSYTLWQWRKNHLYYHKKFLKAVKEFNVGVIPIHAVVDGDNGYPEQDEAASMHCEKQILRQTNAIHPNPSGYKQMGDCVFAYMKHILHLR